MGGVRLPLAGAPLTGESRTSISSALLFAGYLLRTRPVNEYARRTIDVSGDGPNNDGRPVAPVRDRLVNEGVVINGLPILIRPTMYGGRLSSFTLDQYYEACVIGGPGSFMITVADPADFEQAIRRKLVLEIAGVEPQAQVVPVAETSENTVDCLVGERFRG